MTVRQVNDRLRDDVCRDTLAAISDETLSPIFEQSPEVKKLLRGIDDVLFTADIHARVHDSIYARIRPLLIPEAVKTATRVRVFHEIVTAHIVDLALSPDRFDVAFNTRCPLPAVDHVPDWYIFEKATHKLLVGINQLNLSGCRSRVAMYIDSGSNGVDFDGNVKYLCVLGNHERVSAKGRIHDLFVAGFTNNTVCFVKQLRDVIRAYFCGF